MSQLVATNTASPAMRPVTKPTITAFSRTTRTRIRSSSFFASRAMGALLDELEEAFEQMELGAAPQDGQREEERNIAEEGERPPSEESDPEPIEEAEHAARRRHRISRQELAEESEIGPDHQASLEHEDHGGEEEGPPAHRAGGHAEGHAVDPGEDLGDPLVHFLRPRLDFLVILLLRVHAPQIVMLVLQEISHGEEAGQHGVVLVVVPMQAVPADGLEILEPVHELPHQGQGVAVAGVIHGIGLGHPEHASVADLRRPPESDLLQLALAERDELGIGQDPQRVMLLAEVLEAEARLARL